MKKISTIKLAIAFASALVLSACGDNFLSVEPGSKAEIEGYYTTKEHIDEAVTAAYDPLHWFDYYYNWCPLFLVADVMGDDIYVGGANEQDQQEMHLASQYRLTPLLSFKGIWLTCYTGINRCNLVVKYAQESSLDASVVEAFVDEATTLRAYYYLQLWKLWGNIPYYETNLEYPYLAEQLTPTEVYNNVIPELEDVLNSQSLPMKDTDARAGHATWAFAAMLYADYVMYEQDESHYAQALTYMKKVVDSGEYELMDDFSAIWEKSGEWCKESIFEINYFSNGSTRDYEPYQTNPGGTGVPSLLGVDGLTGSPDYEGGWGFGDVSKEVYDLYEPTDQRRDGGILCMETYIAENAAKGITVSYGGRYQNTGLFLRKCLGRIGGKEGAGASGDLGWDNNLRIYRYAETLLNASELALRTGDNASAQVYYDMVRGRAGASSRLVSLDNLLEERRLELVGEGKRYFDLIRFGKAAETLKPGGGKVLNTEKTAYSQNGNPNRVQWTEGKKYLPIPQDEIDAAQGALKQNDDY